MKTPIQIIEIESSIQNMIRKELSKYVKGKISVTLYRDNLEISVFTKEHGTFRHTIPRIFDKVLYGIDYMVLTRTFVQDYRKYILSKYFWKTY